MINPFSVLTSKIYGGVAVAALAFAAVQTVRIEGLSIWPLKIEGYSAANTRLKADLAAVAAAQIEAKRRQQAADQENTAAQLPLNQEVNNAHALVETARRVAVADYIRTHRVQPKAACSVPGSSRPADVPADPSEPADETGPADMVAVTRSDFDKLTLEALQGAERYNYLHSLILLGLAVPEPTFGE